MVDGRYDDEIAHEGGEQRHHDKERTSENVGECHQPKHKRRSPLEEDFENRHC